MTVGPIGHLDDWPPLHPIPGRAGAQGFVDTHVVERLWKEQFDFAYREYDTFIFPMVSTDPLYRDERRSC